MSLPAVTMPAGCFGSEDEDDFTFIFDHKMKDYLKRIPLIYKANALVKGFMQEKSARRALARYRRVTAKRQITPLYEREKIQFCLRNRLINRVPFRWPKPKGTLHIFLAYYVNNWETILPRALSVFGKVTVFNWRAIGFDDTASNWLTRRDKMNKAMLDAFMAPHREEPVDVVVGYLSGYNTAPEILEFIARQGAAIFNFCWDDKINFPGRKVGGRYTSTAAIAHAVDLNLTNAHDSIVKYAIHGGLAMFWPEAAHPEIHRPYDIPFEFDVSFVGACYGWRPTFIKRLERKGIKVECFGPGWPNGPLSNEEMVKLYSRSRVNLGFAGVGHSRRLTCLKGRDFEVPISGGLYLTQASPELSLVYKIGKEILVYRDTDDCARLIREVLANPDRAAAIRIAGRNRCLRDHTYEARWSQVFRLAGIMI